MGVCSSTEPVGKRREESSLNDNNLQYRETFNTVIAGTLDSAIRLAAADPALVLSGISILRNQKKASSIRQQYERDGILVPPVMMISVTSRCNLACKGCYQRAQHRNRAPEMNEEALRSVVSQAAELGVSVIVFAGGEPLLRKDEILSLAKSHPAILFAAFTNGQLIDDSVADEIAGLKNIVPMLSFEGFRAETDLRRGSGVYDRLLAAGKLLNDHHSFFGISVTVTFRNIDRVLSNEFVSAMAGTGARAFVFVEYVPIEPGTDDLVLAPEQRAALSFRLQEFNRKYPALFIGFPGDEEMYGGCLAAGRGFVHVSPSGDLEPCPAAPFSDANLTKIPLIEAFRSDFLEKIRSNHNALTETNGGCALWTNRDWVQGLLAKQ
ncbi:MAG: pyrroloquinoline quinone biosynthesis protein PqqE [Methanoregula sp. PtaU1.Bin051]|nr:MAG: pyrroloquinoline quinone biosynthesis protein PqqE [Methanoregula sp. PtaU1.Bin051]